MNYVQTSSFQAKAKICDMVSFLQKNHKRFTSAKRGVKHAAGEQCHCLLISMGVSLLVKGHTTEK